MAMIKQIVVPDIGSANKVEVIEILVAVGDAIKKDDSIVTLESDKASMEIPSTEEGVVKNIRVSVGDKVNKGAVILDLEQANGVTTAPEKTTKVEQAAPAKAKKSSQTITLPDLGTASDVDVIDIMVNLGDAITENQSLIMLEGDKATMEIPSPFTGVLTELKIKVGDKVKTGSAIAVIETVQTVDGPKETPVATTQQDNEAPRSTTVVDAPREQLNVVTNRGVYAGPAVRRLAREFGVDLNQVTGTARKNRIVKEDVQHYVKQMLVSTRSGISTTAAPKIDFSLFGEVQFEPLKKIKRITGLNTHRSWITVPHVTQFDEADITELEAFRHKNKEEAQQQGYKLTPLVFVMKAVVAALRQFPSFNSSLDERAENLYLKKYFHVGVAVDTPNGLVVPVIRDVDKKGIAQLAQELAQVSSRAREKGLMPKDMEGGCFTISSLGGIGGTAFTPIINTPEVAILGVSKAKMQPVFDGKAFIPRLILPLSLSYDHRVIDGAEAARFTQFISYALADVRRLLL